MTGDAHTAHAADGSPYRLVRRDSHPRFRGNRLSREVRVGAVTFGAGAPVIIAGPCAVESEEQTLEIARACAAAGAQMLRGGAFKPRTSPHDFQGLGRRGLEILARARDETGLPIVTEALAPRQVGIVAEYADCLQIGARSMQNFPLLREAGRAGIPVLLKRHWAATLTEWLCAAEYIAAEGNLDIILCERGIRTFTNRDYCRSTLDVHAVPAVRRETFLPVIVDPSHAAGLAEFVPATALAGIAAGADGLIIEVIADHTQVCDVRCDGPQSIRPAALHDIVARTRAWSAIEPFAVTRDVS